MYQVLLVDDEPAILDAEKRAIKRKTTGFEVIGEAYSVDQAIALIEKQKPDVVLTDMKMPKKLGVELIKYISELEDAFIVCIAVSGHADFDYVHDAFLYGAFDYMLKPMDPEKVSELFIRIERLLEKRNQPNNQTKLMTPKLTGEKQIEEIEKYIHRHIAEDTSMLRICSRFAISQPYLSKMFKKHKSCTYNEYVTKVKMDLAREYLKENYLIGEVADMLGYADQFYFSKVFKSEVGLSPKDYKKKYMEE